MCEICYAWKKRQPRNNMINHSMSLDVSRSKFYCSQYDSTLKQLLFIHATRFHLANIQAKKILLCTVCPAARTLIPAVLMV